MILFWVCALIQNCLGKCPMKQTDHLCLDNWSQYHSKSADGQLLWFTENCSSKNSVRLSKFRVLHITFIYYTDKKLNTFQNFLQPN